MENYSMLFKEDSGPLIFPQKTYSYDFSFSPESEREYRLFFTGETELFYYWKTEYCSRALYKRISDALVPGKTTAWGVEFKGADYPRILTHKVLWQPSAAYIKLKDYTEKWKIGVSAAAENLKIRKDGYLRLSAEIRLKHTGKIKNHTKDEPDKVYTIDFPQGSYNTKKFELEIDIPNDAANVNYIIEGENFEGRIVFEAPFLTSSNGYNIIPSFAPDTAIYQRYFNWLGVNLSRAEWPCMKIDLNGKTVFDGEFFERCHRYSEKEITLPERALINGNNHIEFTVTSDWHDALPYRLHELGIVSEAASCFNILSCPEVVTENKPFSLLLDIKEPCTLRLKSEAKAISPLTFKKPGLNFLRLVYNGIINGLDITLSNSEHTEKCRVLRVVKRGEDGVITGTGDMVYINQDITDTENYLKWYMQNNIGQLITIRLVYRWSGSRNVHTDTWQEMTVLFNGLDLKYSHMIDGREPQGFAANPPYQMLAAETGYKSGFLGRQLHERDGAYCYWGDYDRLDDFRDVVNHYDTELLFDNMMRQHRQYPDKTGQDAHPSEMYDDGSRYRLCHNPYLPADMEIQARDVINSLRVIKRDASRHTGPSILFKYFCMAGYDWIGAETMDSPTEFLMAALRGTARAFNIERTGVHHALQWSSSPHDDPMRFMRYRLALYVTWMQGAHEINTEEGLWHMEECYFSHHRFSHAAKEHLKMQQDFSRYVATHQRRGYLRTKVGVLHGRYDGYPCFSHIVWGQSKSRFNPDFDAELSWQMPKLSFFPIDDKSWTTFKHFSHGEPFGLVSGNPRGNLDIVPVEKPIGNYGLLAFFGYNKAEKSDLDEILKAVMNGAELMLSLAHLTDTTDRDDLENYRLHFFEHEIFKYLGFDSLPEFTADSFNGTALPVAENIKADSSEIIMTTDRGRALLIEKKVGDGKIILFNTKYYPANPAIKDLYTAEFERRADEQNSSEHAAPMGDAEIQTAVYDLENGDCEIYFIAIDWWNTPENVHKAELKVGDSIYSISLPHGIMKKAYVHGDIAVWADSESADILCESNGEFTVSGIGIEQFHIGCCGKVKTLNVDFTSKAQKIIKF